MHRWPPAPAFALSLLLSSNIVYPLIHVKNIKTSGIRQSENSFSFSQKGGQSTIATFQIFVLFEWQQIHCVRVFVSGNALERMFVCALVCVFYV